MVKTKHGVEDSSARTQQRGCEEHQKPSGGLGDPLERSQKTEEAPWREGLERKDDVSGQEGCMVESSEKSMGGASTNLGGEIWMHQSRNGG